MKYLFGFFMMLSLIMLCAGTAFCEDDPIAELEKAYKEVEEEMRWLQAETFVITASRVLEDIKKSAASITVVTDRQIRQMGARHLMDVLRTVPGMSYRYHPDGQYKIDSRGVSKSAGQDVLIMLNGHPLNSNFTGGATWTYDTLIPDNIQRIEVIRGPGSAMYGANAFSGVINIITKSAEDIDGVQFRASRGSCNTQQYNFLLGKTWHDIAVTFNLNYLNTDGFEPHIEQDAQTLNDLQSSLIPDPRLHTNASLAPGHGNGYNEKYDLSLGLQYKGLKFDGRYVKREREPPLSVVDTLGDNNTDKSEDYYLNLSYQHTLGENLDIFGKIYRNRNHYHSYYEGNKGTLILRPEPLAPQGFAPEIIPYALSASPSNKNTRTGIEIQTTYRVNDSNTLVSGITYEKMKQYDVKYAANFTYTPVQNVIVPLGAMQELTDIQNYNKDADREFKAFFIQDIWDIRDNLRLTLGGRYDDYSDFGDSFNPRVGLTWAFAKDFDIKLLYGRAFRAPSFYELYTQNNPSIQGNPDLKPETVDTYEISLGAEFDRVFSGRITGFQNIIKDTIDQIFVESQGGVFQNKDELRSQGFEIEMKYDFGRGTYLAMNYTFQDTENLDTKESLWNVPRHKGNIMANVRLSKYLNFYTDLHFQDGYERENEDIREDHSGFEIVNITLIAKKFIKGLEIRGSIYNLFDKEYTFPTPVDTLPVDIPMPGRNFIFELQYKF